MVRPVRNPAETLLALHLDELGCNYERGYHYALPRKFNADFGIIEGGPCDERRRWLLIEITGGIYGKKGTKCKLCGRMDKGAHGSITGILKDNERLNAATMAGYQMFRFTP